MSTRCQVRVIQEGTDWKQSVTLYHHCDGYPSNMLPLIASAYKPTWEHGRAGKVASFLCVTDAGAFEPEDGHELHGDIEWYYILHIRNTRQGTLGDVPQWTIEVFDTPSAFWKKDNPTEKDLRKIASIPLKDATEARGLALEDEAAQRK